MKSKITAKNLQSPKKQRRRKVLRLYDFFIKKIILPDYSYLQTIK